jgi:hypothetical protein
MFSSSVVRESSNRSEWLPSLVDPSLVVAAWAIRVGLSASFASAAAARHALVLDDLAIKVVLGLDNATKEHPAVVAQASFCPAL